MYYIFIRNIVPLCRVCKIFIFINYIRKAHTRTDLRVHIKHSQMPRLRYTPIHFDSASEFCRACNIIFILCTLYTSILYLYLLTYICVNEHSHGSIHKAEKQRR